MKQLERRSRLGGLALLWLGLAVALLAPRAVAAPPNVHWVSPASLIVLPWPGDPSAARVAENTASLRVAPGEVLLIPAEPGDVVQLAAESGEAPTLGLASGQAEWPDVITWDTAATNELALPSWSTASFVAARVARATQLSIRIATRDASGLDWYRWERALGAWLFEQGAPPSLPDASTGARLVRWLDVLVQSLAPSERGAAADLLQACWLEQSARYRPLASPYFTPEPRLSSDEPRVYRAGERWEVVAPGVDVVRWKFQAAGAARVLVREGNAVERVLTWSAPVPSGPAPSAPVPAAPVELGPVLSRARSVRVVPPAATGRVAFEVLEGSVTVQQGAWTQRIALSEVTGQPLRGRQALLERARRSPLPWVQRLAEARATRQAVPADLAALALRLPGDLRSWLLLEAARNEPEPTAAAVLAERAAAAARTLPLEIAALEQRWNVLATPLATNAATPGERPTPRTDITPASASATDDELLVAALRARYGSTDGLRPAWGATLERWAAERNADRDVWTAVAGYWRSVPYRSVLPEPGASVGTEYVPLEPAECEPSRAAGAAGERSDDRVDRWLLPEPGATPLSAQLPAQRYAKLVFKPLGTWPQPERSVQLDGVPVPVHSGAGLSSEIAIAAGEHRLETPAGPTTFVVRLSEGVTAPCERLRRARTWTELRAAARADFVLPAPGTSSVARLTVSRAPDDGAPSPQHELSVRVGDRRFVVWARGTASGSSELPIEAPDTALSLGSASPVRARVELRRAPDAPNAVRSARAQGGKRLEPQADLEQVLETLRELARSLRATTHPASRQALHERRARLLDALGFSGLARRDAAPEPPEARQDWLWLPAESGAVISLNLAAKVPALPLPAAPTSLVERRRRVNAVGCAALGAEPDPGPALGADAESLLVGYCAEQNGLLPLAARAYQAVGQHPSGAALLRAASLTTDHSLATSDPALALRARLLASRAFELGEDTSDLLARLGPAIGWVVPSSYEHALGFATVEQSAAPNPTLVGRVRRALVDAPDDALLMDGEQVIEIVARSPAPLELQTGCDEVSDGTCQAFVQLDGGPASCAPEAPGSQRCRLALPPAVGKYRVRVGLRSPTALGWVEAKLAGKPLAPRLASRWIEVESATPAQLTVLAPTLVVLEARGAGVPGQALTWTPCGGGAEERVLALPAERDSGAARVGSEQRALGTPLRVELPLLGSGPCTLELRASPGTALVRLSIARAQGLPLARSAPAPLPADAPSLPAVAPLPLARDALGSSHAPAPFTPRDGLPLTWLGRSRAVSAVLSPDVEGTLRQNRRSTRYVELSGVAARELVPNVLWGSLQTGVRWRDGTPTWLGRTLVELPPTTARPGFELDAMGYFQAYDAALSGSLRATGSVSGLFQLAPNVALRPSAAYTLDREPDAPSDPRGVDVDVYSAYRAERPHYASVELATTWRPLVDGFGKLELSARGLPDFDGLDRTTAGLSWFMLPLPEVNALLELSGSSSYRPEGPLRSRSFLRHGFGVSASYWHWLSDSERLRAFARLDGAAETPYGPSGGATLAAELGLELLMTGQRGLQDLARTALPFRDFQERRRDADPAASTEQAPSAASGASSTEVAP